MELAEWRWRALGALLRRGAAPPVEWAAELAGLEAGRPELQAAALHDEVRARGGDDAANHLSGFWRAHARLPGANEVFDGQPVGAWVARAAARRAADWEDSRAQVWQWGGAGGAALFAANLDLLRRFAGERGRMPLPLEHYGRTPLGHWVDFCRLNWAACAPRERRALEAVDFWCGELEGEDEWAENLDHLDFFIDQHDRLPRRGEGLDGTDIGAWTERQYYAEQTLRLSEERREALESTIGWPGWACPPGL